jgi:hypothetical protein
MSAAPEYPIGQRSRPDRRRHSFYRALGQLSQWLAGLTLTLSVVACEYNVDVAVRIPRWETATSAVGVLGVVPRSLTADPAGPYDAVDCEQPPTRIAVSFFLANERDEAVAEGDRLNVGGSVIHPNAARMMDPVDESQSVSVDLLTLDDGNTNPVSLMGTVEEVWWHSTAADLPARLVLLHDHSTEAAEHDTADQRLAAYSELVGESLCHETMAIRCPLPDTAAISLYRMDDDNVEDLVQTSRDYDQLQLALDVLRNEGERGDAPLFGATGGLSRSMGECGDSAATPCWPAMVLISGEPDETLADSLDSATFPESTRLLAAGLTDSPALRRLACQTGGFFESIERLSDLRLLTNKSTTELPEYAFGFARKALLAARGRWEVVLSITGVPDDLDMSHTFVLGGTLGVRLGSSPNDHTALTEFQVTLGGY